MAPHNRRALLRYSRYAFLFLLAASLIYAARCAIGPSQEQVGIRKLIDALASQNAEPTYIERKDYPSSIPIPADYDRQAQFKVLEAWRLLLDAGPKAFPALVAAVGDRRYCCSLNSTPGDGQWNCSVGAVCGMILRNQIDAPCYRIERSYGPNTLWDRAARKTGVRADVTTWWRQRRHRTLAELQIETAQCAVGILKSEELPLADLQIDLTECPLDTPVSERAPSELATNEDKAEKTGSSRREIARQAVLKDIEKLESLIRQIKASGQPLAPISIENPFCRMIGLPDDSDCNHSHPYPPEREPSPKE